MKGKMLIVLFGLVLAFGALVASCDNGVLPKYVDDPKNVETDLKNQQADAEYYVDMYTQTYNPYSCTFGSDGTADNMGAWKVKASEVAAYTQKATEGYVFYIIDPADQSYYVYTLAGNVTVDVDPTGGTVDGKLVMFAVGGKAGSPTLAKDLPSNGKYVVLNKGK